jgi:acyl-CoA reductase-like NAD-dependent aldehyde dehydrogenase
LPACQFFKKIFPASWFAGGHDLKSGTCSGGKSIEAIRIANDSEFGLAAGIFTTNLDTAQRARRDFQAGVVTINNYFRGWLGTTFGRMKNTGLGREHGVETIREYVRSKNVRAASAYHS